MKLHHFALLVPVLLLSVLGCSATPRADEDQFVVKKIDVATCIIYRPSSAGVEGTRMECDFR